ncbi:MAG: insulinase family protein [Chloroflexi bacterium]|nr:insulinase family protein [Chloroflexota bacterium]
MTEAENGIVKKTLANGLTIRLKEIRTTPLISSWIWYRVGSRNEKPGTTGISHWVEHMQFKGTPTYPGGMLDRAIARDGGVWNAMTWVDWTAYYETLPSDRLDLALKLEADRMVNSVFDPDDVESERTVIISERQGHENEPTNRLGEEIQAMSFRVHSYHHGVIGDMVDLETISRDDLYNHYREYYTPSNALLAIAGDFDTETVLEKIQDYFGEIASSPKPDFKSREEPQQKGERRVTLEGPGTTPFVEVVYHAPPGDHPDFMVLSVLDSVLSGASSVGLSGGGISNKTSRLYRRLVEGELAAAVSGSLAATIDPFVYSIRATVRGDGDPDKVQRILDEEIDRLLQTKVDSSEIAKAIKQARALFAYGSESTTNVALWLGFSEMFATYEWFETYLERVAEVNSEQVMEIARKYLQPSNRVLGIYRPTEGNSSG